MFGFVIYSLVPMMTKVEFKSRLPVNLNLCIWLVGAVGMTLPMGMAGATGMLRRTLYVNGEFRAYTFPALIFGNCRSGQSAAKPALAFTSAE
jgi:heme/copper-type cytochrome/quinol oxidase subunit 1